MTHFAKRITSIMLAVLLVLSTVVGTLPTVASAKTGTLVSNTGTRHETCTSLSSQAQAYYTGDYSWENLSAMTGGNENCLDTDNELFEALHTLMSSTMTNSVSYKSLPTYWAKTDATNGSSTNVFFYSDVVSTDSLSREHVWPKGHASFNEKNGGSDLHHLRPTNGGVNNSRDNLIMGNVKDEYPSHSTYSYNGDVVLYKTNFPAKEKDNIVEVNDNIKGDVARILLYVWCRWEEPNLFKDTPTPVIGAGDNKNDGKKVIESLETLLQWCALDPVDTWEMSRNDQVENIQGNRNVFIDYPELAWLVFGKDVPENITTPSKHTGISGNPSTGDSSSGDSSSGDSSSGDSSSGDSSSGCNHNWGEGQVSVSASCATPGLKVYTCSSCGQTKNEEIPPIGKHTYGAWITVTEPDINKQGIQKHTCLICGQEETQPMAAIAYTSADNSGTMIVVSIVAMVVLIGGIAVFFLVKKKNTAAKEADPSEEITQQV